MGPQLDPNPSSCYTAGPSAGARNPGSRGARRPGPAQPPAQAGLTLTRTSLPEGKQPPPTGLQPLLSNPPPPPRSPEWCPPAWAGPRLWTHETTGTYWAPTACQPQSRILGTRKSAGEHDASWHTPPPGEQPLALMPRPPQASSAPVSSRGRGQRAWLCGVPGGRRAPGRTERLPTA